MKVQIVHPSFKPRFRPALDLFSSREPFISKSKSLNANYGLIGKVPGIIEFCRRGSVRLKALTLTQHSDLAKAEFDPDRRQGFSSRHSS